MQSYKALNQQYTANGTTFNRQNELLKINQAALLSPASNKADDTNFFAEKMVMRVDFDLANVIDHSLVIRQVEIFDSQLNLVYFAKGDSNLSRIQQHLAQFLANRLSNRKKLDWDIYNISFYNTKFTLTDIDGVQIVDAVIPKIEIPVVSNQYSPKENKAKVLFAIRLAMYKEIIKGRAKGQYNLPRLQQFAAREFKGHAIDFLNSQQVQQIKQRGFEMIKGVLNEFNTN